MVAEMLMSRCIWVQVGAQNDRRNVFQMDVLGMLAGIRLWNGCPWSVSSLERRVGVLGALHLERPEWVSLERRALGAQSGCPWSAAPWSAAAAE